MNKEETIKKIPSVPIKNVLIQCPVCGHDLMHHEIEPTELFLVIGRFRYFFLKLRHIRSRKSIQRETPISAYGIICTVEECSQPDSPAEWCFQSCHDELIIGEVDKPEAD